MSEFKIPKRFKLMGRTVTVREDPNLISDRDLLGAVDYNKSTIVLQDGKPYGQESTEQAMCHELVHLLFRHSSREEFDTPLHTREGLVDRVAGLLHQFLTTLEYEDEPKNNEAPPAWEEKSDEC